MVKSLFTVDNKINYKRENSIKLPILYLNLQKTTLSNFFLQKTTLCNTFVCKRLPSNGFESLTVKTNL